MFLSLLRALSITATAVVFVVSVPGAVKASTLTYDVTLTGSPESGTGYFTITTPAVGTSGNLTEGHGLTAMNFTIDGLNFAMNSLSQIGYYYSGSTLVLDNIGYTGTNGNFQLTGISLVGYYFGDNGPNGWVYDTNGTLSYHLAATPLPATWSMLLIGLAVFGFVSYRGTRHRSVAIAAA